MRGETGFADNVPANCQILPEQYRSKRRHYTFIATIRLPLKLKKSDLAIMGWIRQPRTLKTGCPQAARIAYTAGVALVIRRVT